MLDYQVHSIKGLKYLDIVLEIGLSQVVFLQIEHICIKCFMVFTKTAGHTQVYQYAKGGKHCKMLNLSL